MLFNSSVYISRHTVRLADKNCDVSVITLYYFERQEVNFSGERYKNFLKHYDLWT